MEKTVRAKPKPKPLLYVKLMDIDLPGSYSVGNEGLYSGDPVVANRPQNSCFYCAASDCIVYEAAARAGEDLILYSYENRPRCR